MQLSYTGSGSILFQEKEYRCDLFLNENEGGILFKIYIGNAMASFIELPFEIDSVSGKLDNGFVFTAFGCSRIKMENMISEGQSVFTFLAHSMLKGVGASDSNAAKLYRVQFGLAHILEWGSFSAYRINENFELSAGEHTEIIIFSDDQITIRYLVSSSTLPVSQEQLLKDKITLSQQGIIELQSKVPQTIVFFEKYYQKIKRLIEISMRKTIRLAKVTGWSHSVCYEIEGKHIETPISILTADFSSANQKSQEGFVSWQWFTLPELLANNSFSLYLKKYDLLEPIIELYLEAFSPYGISTNRLFLNLVQGLESYHSRFVTNELKMFKNRIDNVILKNRPKQLIEKDTAFLMDGSKHFITLESRLADLLIANFEIVFDTGDIKREDFPGVIANTRNYLIHNDERIKQKKRVLTEDEIGIYNQTLCFILEYYLLRELGYKDTNAITEKLHGRWSSVSTTLSIINASKQKEGLQINN